MNILLIEDDSAVADSLQLMLESEGLHVCSTGLGEDGIDLGKSRDYDLVILDLGLPDMPGFEVLTALRAAKVHTPVLVLSGAADVEARVKALSLGADDYVTKPFHKDELFARIHAIMRRTRSTSHQPIAIGKISVDLDAKTVEADGKKIKLTIKEYELLEILALRKGVQVTKEALFSLLYGGIDEPAVKIVDVFICKLRKKLMDATGGDNYIKTIWGYGYQMDDLAPADRAAA